MNLNHYGSEENFVAALRRGEPKAYEFFYKECRPMILNFVRKNSGREEDGKDLLQEGIIKLFEKFQEKDFVLTCKPNVYLYSICRNKWLAHLRDIKTIVNDVSVFINLPAPEPPDEDPLPSNEQLQEYINKLDEVCRELLISFYYSEYSLEEIARNLKLVNANVAKVRRFRCMQRLKDLIINSFKI